jgi:hypothetical protein
VLLFLGLVAALCANAYQFVKGERLAREVTLLHRDLQAQITRLSDATSGAFDVTQQRFEDMKKLQDSTATALIDARTELRTTTSQVSAELEEKNQELARRNRDLMAQLASLKQETSAKFQNTSAKIETTSAKLAQISTEAERNRAALKQVTGDLGAVRTNIVPVSIAKQAPVRESADRDRIPFDLLKTKVPTQIGDIQIAIRGTDLKKNRYTMDLYADDKVTLEGNHSVNEAVQFYLAGRQLPHEIVVTEVRKDEVIGYVSAPRVTAPKIQTPAAAPRSSAVAASH